VPLPARRPGSRPCSGLPPASWPPPSAIRAGDCGKLVRSWCFPFCEGRTSAENGVSLIQGGFAVVRRGTICLCGSDRRAPDRRAGPRRAVRRLVTILRREAAAGVSAALLHLADACCPADVAVPPVLPAGKSRVTSGYTASSLAVVRQLTDIIQQPPNAVPRPTIRPRPRRECTVQITQSGRPQTATLVDAGTRRTAALRAFSPTLARHSS